MKWAILPRWSYCPLSPRFQPDEHHQRAASPAPCRNRVSAIALRHRRFRGLAPIARNAALWRENGSRINDLCASHTSSGECAQDRNRPRGVQRSCVTICNGARGKGTKRRGTQHPQDQQIAEDHDAQTHIRSPLVWSTRNCFTRPNERAAMAITAMCFSYRAARGRDRASAGDQLVRAA